MTNIDQIIMNKFKDEMTVEMISALGQALGKMYMPLKMKDMLIKAYIESGAVKSTHLFIDGKEITDGLNHNPFHHI